MKLDRRNFLKKTTQGAIAAATAASITGCSQTIYSTKKLCKKRGSQRLSLKKLQTWETWGYGLFVSFGMSTFTEKEKASPDSPPSLYAPDKLDVDQWICVARDAGMKYAVLTAKHHCGHCLWPSKHTDYTVANSTDKTDVVEKFVDACRKRGIKPGLYYCSDDSHHRFGGDYAEWDWAMSSFPKGKFEKFPPYSSSLYQTFQTAQVTELLTNYGPIAETWIDIPGILGRGYRTFLYNHIAQLQPGTVIMMNSGFGDGSNYRVDYACPSDLIAIERDLPPKTGHKKYRMIEGKEYYLPAEVCDPIGKNWFYVSSDKPKPDAELLNQYQSCRQRAANLLLSVPPDKHGLFPKESIQALMRLKKNANI